MYFNWDRALSYQFGQWIVFYSGAMTWYYEIMSQKIQYFYINSKKILKNIFKRLKNFKMSYDNMLIAYNFFFSFLGAKIVKKNKIEKK